MTLLEVLVFLLFVYCLLRYFTAGKNLTFFKFFNPALFVEDLESRLFLLKKCLS